MTTITIARAHESEAPACLALLPRFTGQAELMIARVDGEFAGAAGLSWINALDPAGFFVEARVLSRWRRKGVGRALIDAAADLADGETDGLWSLDGAPSASPAAMFLEACGFKPFRREYHYEIVTEKFLAGMIDLSERLRRKGRVPERAEIRWLADPEAPLDEIAWLVSRELGAHPMASLQNLRRRRDDIADHSLYVRVEGEVCAVMLFHTEGHAAVVDIRVVARRWRNNWPNAVMLEKGLNWAISNGFAKARFFADERVRDTINLARRGDGEETGVKNRYYLNFDDTS
jgi:GNAT superfamily N-acetyltransferase